LEDIAFHPARQSSAAHPQIVGKEYLADFASIYFFKIFEESLRSLAISVKSLAPAIPCLFRLA
jgi:hypothetical protein